MTKGLIFNIQRFSLHDGPGIRTTVFFKGCPLQCQWCQNPEGISSIPVLFCYRDRCLACQACREQCPAEAISIEPSGPVIDRNRCTLCLKCTSVCPVEAIQAAGTEITVPELTGEILKDRLVFEESGGGVTFSGGEPLMQPEFLSAMLKALKKENIHIAVETSGYASWPLLKRISEWTDLFLYDLKIIDPELSTKYTGASSVLSKNNLKQLIKYGSNVQIRMPLIPSVNDSSESLIRTAEFLKQCGVTELEFIPYHDFGRAKYDHLNLEYLSANILVSSSEQLFDIYTAMEQNGIKIINEVG